MKRNATGTAMMKALAALALLAILGCANPLGPARQKGQEGMYAPDGSILVAFQLGVGFAPRSLSPELASKTVYPNGDPSYFVPDDYHIQANGPGGATVTADLAGPTGMAGGFIDGYWTFNVTASKAGSLLASGSTSVRLTAGQANAVTMLLQPAMNTSAYGYLSYSVTLNASLAIAHLEVSFQRLKPLDGTSTSYSLDSGPVFSAIFNLPVGMYVMNSVLSDGSPSNVVWGESEIVYIMEDPHTHSYTRVLEASALGKAPAQLPAFSLPPGLVIDNGDGGTNIDLGSLPAGLSAVYSTDNVAPAADAGGVVHGFAYLSGQNINLNASQADGNQEIVVRARYYNQYGMGPELIGVYRVSDTAYVNTTSPNEYGTATNPFTNPQTAFDRIRDMKRVPMTEVRIGIGNYTGNFKVFGNTRIIGSFNAATWASYYANPADESLFTPADSTIFTSDNSSGPSIEGSYPALAIVGQSAPVECLSLGLLSNASSPIPGSYHSALKAVDDSAPLSFSQVLVKGQSPGSYHSYGAVLVRTANATFTDCYIKGRENSPGSGTEEVAAMHIEDSGVALAASTVIAGIGHMNGAGYGIHSLGNSSLSLNGTASQRIRVDGPLNPTTGTNYGIRAESATDLNMDYCDLSDNFGNQTKVLSIEKGRGRIYHSTITSANGSGGQSALGIFFQGPAGPYSAAAINDLELRYSTVSTGSSAIMGSESTGISILGGKALIADNVLISGGDADFSVGKSYGIKIAPTGSDWAEAEIRGNSLIQGKTAYASAGILISSKTHVIVEANANLNSSSAGGGVGATRNALDANNILAIPERGIALPMLEIRDNGHMFSASDTSNTLTSNAGLRIVARDAEAPILVERNKISGGIGSAGTEVNGVYAEIQGGGQKAPFVFRNNIVYSGTGGSLGNGMYLTALQPVAPDGRIILANNTLICSSSDASNAALAIGGYAQPELYNNIFFAAGGPFSYSLKHLSSSTPAYVLNNVFAHQSTLLYYYDGTMSVNPLLINTPAFNSNVGVPTSSLNAFFSQTITSMANFEGFTGSPLGCGADVRDGGLVLSNPTSVMGIWFFADDFYNLISRDPFWSCGAVNLP